MTLRDTSGLYARLAVAGMALLGVLGFGTLGYRILGHHQWSWFDCFYMTVITLSTVGFGEVLRGLEAMPQVRAWTMVLIVMGSGTLVYFVSTLTAIIIEGDLRGTLKRKRMKKHMTEISDHILVCGVGTTGVHVVSELAATQTPFIIIDHDENRINQVLEAYPNVLYIVGDAADDHVLREAGIERARGVISALHEDRDNLFVAVTARAINPKLRIVTKAVEHSASPKLLRAGVDAVVSGNYIGGMRMVSEMVRPTVVQFLDLMLRDKDKNLRIEEVAIPPGSRWASLALRDADLRRVADVLVIAVRSAQGQYLYNPGPDLKLEVGMVLIVLAQTTEIVRLRAAAEQSKG